MRKPMVLIVLLAAGVAWPLCSRGYDRWYAARRVGAGYGVGLGMGMAAGGYGYGGVGTAFSAQENARANTIRAQGEYNMMNTAAMSNFEDARSKYIDNQQKWTQVYLERQRAAAELKSQREAEDAARKERIKAFNEANPPTPPAGLTSSQLDPSTGQIQWPTALAATAFDGQRQSLEALFALRTQASANAELTAKVVKAVNEMKSTLRAKIREIPTADYLEARRFLDGLAVESRSPVG